MNTPLLYITIVTYVPVKCGVGKSEVRLDGAVLSRWRRNWAAAATVALAAGAPTTPLYKLEYANKPLLLTTRRRADAITITLLLVLHTHFIIRRQVRGLDSTV